jgi:uncharacterized protein YjbI with pentapeptide repeats
MTKIYHIDDMPLAPEYRRVVHESPHETVAQTVEDAVNKGVSLFKADLRGAILSDTNLINGNFQGAVMTGSRMINANLSGSDFSMADLGAADLTGATLYGARLNIVARADYMKMSGNYALVNAGFGYPLFISDQVINIASMLPMTPEELMSLDILDAASMGGAEFVDNLPRIREIVAFHLGLSVPASDLE